jgi:hypothetical protein
MPDGGIIESNADNVGIILALAPPDTESAKNRVYRFQVTITPLSWYNPSWEDPHLLWEEWLRSYRKASKRHKRTRRRSDDTR